MISKLASNLNLIVNLMDISESILRCHNCFVEAGLLFNELFSRVSSVDTKSDRKSVYNGTVPIFDELQEDQRHSIKNLSGLIQESLNMLESTRHHSNQAHESENLSERIKHLEKLLEERDSTSRRDQIKISTLQEFLVQEIVGGDEARAKVKAKDAELVALAEETKKLRKAAAKQSQAAELRPNGGSLHTDAKESKSSSALSAPLSMIDKFVRKSFGSRGFFGLIVRYDDPYFKVITHHHFIYAILYLCCSLL